MRRAPDAGPENRKGGFRLRSRESTPAPAEGSRATFSIGEHRDCPLHGLNPPGALLWNRRQPLVDRMSLRVGTKLIAPRKTWAFCRDTETGLVSALQALGKRPHLFCSQLTLRRPYHGQVPERLAAHLTNSSTRQSKVHPIAGGGPWILRRRLMRPPPGSMVSGLFRPGFGQQPANFEQ